MHRRKFLNRTGALAAGYSILGHGYTMSSKNEVQQITGGSMQHWFGYYDKWQIDSSGRYALANEVDTFFRSPKMTDQLIVGVIDLQNNNKWTPIGTSQTWGWQQGCMLQWIPGQSQKVVWNDYESGHYISRVYDMKSKKTRTLPRAVYTLSPDGSYALCVDFDRLQFFRPGYGYPSKTGEQTWPKSPDDSGIYKMDLQSGKSQLIVSYRQLAAMERKEGSTSDYYHWFNHLLINPSGTRFIFLNRSRPAASYPEMRAYLKEHPDFRKPGFSSMYVTRAITANTDGTDLYPLNDSGQFSHFIWKGDHEICAWAIPEGQSEAAFFDFRDKTKEYVQVGKNIMTHNGHNTYVPNTNYEWILNDTYPLGDERLQELYLYHIPTRKKVSLGKFHEPENFSGEWRCDLHPRCDQQGKRVFFDSTHNGDKRQMYMIDIENIINSA